MQKVSDTKGVRVRYAPSPTGHWHVGSARTALMNWLFARKHGGAFIVRIEDTDAERSKPEFETEIFEGLAWLGLDYDEGPTWQMADGKLHTTEQKGKFAPYRQSERTLIYKKYLEQLLAEGRAYYCYCSKEDLEAERQARTAEGLPPKYGGQCRNRTAPPPGKTAELIRFKILEVPVEFRDVIRDTVTFDAGLFGDIVIAKNLESPLYNFTAVVDDELMNITHVIRGEDHISNTPKQILLGRGLGFRTPVYAHIPLILNPDRSKMSKRYAETSVLSYHDSGYLPEAMFNFLAFLGWHPKDDREVLSRDELIIAFDLSRVQKAGAIFSQEKLDWMNREHMKQLSNDELAREVRDLSARTGHMLRGSPEFVTKVCGAVRERMKNLTDFFALAEFFFSLPDYDPKLLVWKNDTPETAIHALENIRNALIEVPAEQFTRETILGALTLLIEKHGKGSILWPFRVALSGLTASPDPLTIAEVLGKTESERRVDIAIKKLSAATNVV